MTTKITLSTHDWPVEVTSIDTVIDGKREFTETVAPKSERVFYAHDSREFHFRELPKPEA